MLPKTPEESGMTPHSIYINPNFNRSKTTTATHINPNFLLPRASTTIHLNPNFLQHNLMGQQLIPQVLQLEQKTMQQTEPLTLNTPPPLTNKIEAQLPDVSNTTCVPGPSCKLITKSRMRIIREPKVNQVKVVPTSTTSHSPMIKLGRCKLLRRTLLRTVPPVKVAPKASVVSTTDKYKIDRRRDRSLTAHCVSPLEKIRRRSFVARYALRRSSSLSNKRKLNLSSSKVSKFKLSTVSKNKNLQMLNINGVLYKSTRNKLQRKDAEQSNQSVITAKPKPSTSLPPKTSCGRTVIVRGTRFMMDKQGFHLTRVPDAIYPKPPTVERTNNFRRIDIGGLTYVATSKNVFIRTGNHIARSHVNNAKHKSVQLLTRSLVKSNVPCAIYQHVGKCAAFERGKCRKVHDKRQVAICSRYLRGNCTNLNCLLSHDVSLTKMPVCKFFLQGVCVRSDCPYLHKKVGKNIEICNEFLRGYCRLAEQCNKRHEFLCPDYERNGKCEKINCIYCKKKKQVHKDLNRNPPQEELTVASEEPEAAPKKRYFVDDADREECKQSAANIDDSNEDNENDDLQSARTKLSRPKLGLLPAYIPLS